MTTEQKQAYTEVLNDLSTTLEGMRFSFSRRLSTPFGKLQQITNGFLFDNEHNAHYLKSNPKNEILKEILENAGSQKVVVWSPHVPQLLQTHRLFETEEIEHVLFYGEVSPARRESLVHRFLKDEQCRVCLANPSVGSVGLNFTCAHLEVFLANWCRADERSQAEDRCHRIGQLNGVTIIDILMNHSIEKKILDSLMANIDLEDQILTMKDLIEGVDL